MIEININISDPIAAVAHAGVSKCIEHHQRDIEKATKPIVDGVNKAVEEGWDRDSKAGGISSRGTDGEAARA
jgi:hypothetical protein